MGLRRNLNLLDATSVGIGAIIGAGIFVVLGVTIGHAEPAIVISIVIAGIVAIGAVLHLLRRKQSGEHITKNMNES